MNSICQRSIKKIALFVLAIGVLAFSVQGAFAQSNDFFSNTQSTDQRAAAATPTAPGFDPCRGGTTISSTQCSGAPAGSEPLLDAINLAGLFPKLGPGAVTDNMFGKIERPVNPLSCAGASAFGSNLLNCGDGKYDPTTQGQTIPNVGTNLTTALALNTPIDMTSCGAGSTLTACTTLAAPNPIDPALHRSQVETAFVWNPTTAAGGITMPVNTANMPNITGAPTAKTCAAAASAANPVVCGQESMIETTALGTTTTVVVSLASDWTTTNNAAGTTFPAPTVNWQSRIVQSEFVGGGTFDQTLSGSFLYNGGNFPVTQYPNGQSFTIRAGGTGTPVECIGVGC